MIAQMKMNI